MRRSSIFFLGLTVAGLLLRTSYLRTRRATLIGKANAIVLPATRMIPCARENGMPLYNVRCNFPETLRCLGPVPGDKRYGQLESRIGRLLGPFPSSNPDQNMPYLEVIAPQGTYLWAEVPAKLEEA